MESNKNCPSLWDGLDRGPKCIHPQARVPWSAIELTASGGAFGFDLRLKSGCPLSQPPPQPSPIPNPHSPSSGIVSSGSESLCRIVRRQLCGRGSSASGLGRSPILVWPLNATEVHLCSPIVIAPE